MAKYDDRLKLKMEPLYNNTFFKTFTHIFVVVS